MLKKFLATATVATLTTYLEHAAAAADWGTFDEVPRILCPGFYHDVPAAQRAILYAARQGLERAGKWPSPLYEGVSGWKWGPPGLDYCGQPRQ